LNTTLTPHSITHGDACFAYFNKIWGIPNLAFCQQAVKSLGEGRGAAGEGRLSGELPTCQAG
jgi:hypothetical protein